MHPMHQKCLHAILAAALLSSPRPASGQAPSGEQRASYRISLNQDVFFGFYPTLAANYKANDRLDWTVYSILWTTPGFGVGGGSGLWTEFGSGVHLKTLGGKLTFTPQLGFLNGKLLSNGSFPMALEGIVPNVTANLSASRAEAEFYLGRYTATRRGKTRTGAGGLAEVPIQNNFLHYWVNGGARLSRLLSAGLHYEQLDSSPDGTAAPSPAGLYKWLGPYVQANFGNLSVRFTAGPDVMSRAPGDGNSSFYKLSASWMLP